MISTHTAKKRLEYANEHGIDVATKHFNIALDTLRRYAGLLRQREENDYSENTDGIPKILIFDIETAPLEAWVWQMSIWRTNVNYTQVISEWFMLTWSAKWLFEETVMSDGLTSREALEENDARIVKSLWDLLDQADIVIAHNGDKFDVPNMNTRFILNDIKPPRLYKTIDTLKVARKQFGFTHNNLNALAKVFGFKGKVDVDFQLWVDCRRGSEEALKLMKEYNERDVLLLEEIYLKLRPWIKGHPNLNLLVEGDESNCPVCLSDNIHIDEGNYYLTSSSKFPVFTCEDCGNSGRTKHSLISREKSKNMLVSISR